jgi:hypothetical protein
MELRILTTNDAGAWTGVLERCGHYDFYHLPKYHALAEQMGEGTARLFVASADGHTLALPFLTRSLEAMPGAERDWTDATSVYGYAGPVQSQAAIPQTLIAEFQAALRRELARLKVVSLFSRLNVFVPAGTLLVGLGECRALQKTVSIDLTLPLAAQRAAYRKSVKTAVNKIRRDGVTCVHDRAGTHLEDFVRIYHENMRRVGAGKQYFFSLDYFKQTLHDLGADAYLFMGLHQDRAVCGAFFVETCGILQNHLSGTLDEALPMAPLKLLLDEVRVWATGRGFKVLHMGGGLTTDPLDPLLHFKTGFSDRLHDFSVWRWILDADAYRRLCDAKTHWNRSHGWQSADVDFFPAYRCPASAGVSATTLPPHSALITGEASSDPARLQGDVS